MQEFASRPAQKPAKTRLHPVFREIVVEASRALARLDAARLEELALCCQALNREGNRENPPINKEERLRRAREAREAQADMAVFRRVLEATRANVQVIERLRELRSGRLEYAAWRGTGWSSTGSTHGND
jgi:hypothetical protein